MALIRILVLESRLVAPVFKEPTQLILSGLRQPTRVHYPGEIGYTPCVVPLGIITLKHTSSRRGRVALTVSENLVDLSCLCQANVTFYHVDTKSQVGMAK